MTFTESHLSGAWIIDPTRHQDSRGVFAEIWIARELEARHLDASLAQCNVALSHARGTLRGLHFQVSPFEQVKMIRCTRGALLDVIVDLRPGSATFRGWDAVELTADNHRMIYVPGGFAHGYLTLEDETEAYYHASTPYAPRHEAGLRWDDPAIGIKWPFEPASISDRDRAWPLVGD